jgi:hypothetical protein
VKIGPRRVYLREYASRPDESGYGTEDQRAAAGVQHGVAILPATSCLRMRNLLWRNERHVLSASKTNEPARISKWRAPCLFVGGWRARQEIGAAVTQRNVELLIGRLLTDEEFRDLFLADPERALRTLLDRGFHLTQSEIAALRAIDASLWPRVASEIDPRLRKARMRLPDEP